MVYCPKCGASNEDNARFCANCGENLYPERRRERREEGCFGERREREDECFGLPQGGAIAGIVFGLFIIILGIGIVLGADVGRWIGPLILMVIGVLIVAGVLYRRYR